MTTSRTTRPTRLTRPTRPARRGAALAASVLLTGTLLAGCSDDPGAARDADVPAGSGSAGPSSESTATEGTEPPAGTGTADPAGGTAAANDPALQEFYDQRIGWKPCQGSPQARELECGELRVPLDYDEPAGEAIGLFVLRVPARGQSQGSLVVNPGGPGGSGVSFAAAAPKSFGAPLLESFDVVGFDPRGVGLSTPVDCLTDRRLDAYRATESTPDDAGEVRTLLAARDRFARGCAARSGALVEHVSTEEVARDLDVLRGALGEEQLTYYGASYGTALGATYAELFPDHAGRLVLDAAVDLTLDPVEKAVGQAGGFQLALEAFLADCVASGRCPLGRTEARAAAAVRALLDVIDRRPIRGGSGRPLTSSLALAGMVAPLYDEKSWPELLEALVLAGRGDGRGLLALADAFAGRVDGAYVDNREEAIGVINCLDDPRGLTPGQVASRTGDFEDVAPVLGSYFAWGALRCAGGGRPRTVEVDAAGAAPILVVGSTRDPATPYAWSEALADQLESGVLLTREGDGHVAYTTGEPCVTDAIEAFLVEGTVPEDGTTCEE